MKKIKSLTALIIVLALCVSSLSIYAKNEEKEIVKQKQIEKMVDKYEKKINKEKNLSQEAKASYIKAYRKREEEIYDSLIEATLQADEKINQTLISTLSTSDYTGIPSDIRDILYGSSGRQPFATEAKSYADDNGVAQYVLGDYGKNTENKVGVDVGFLDATGSAWAWTGVRHKYYDILNNGAVDVRFYIDDVSLLTDMSVTVAGSSCQLMVDYRIFDATTGEWVYDDSIKHITLIPPAKSTDPRDYYKNIASTFDVSATISCQPDHTYVPLILIDAYGHAPNGTAKINYISPMGLSWYDMWYDATQ